jgi:hypothetical protein
VKSVLAIFGNDALLIWPFTNDEFVTMVENHHRQIPTHHITTLQGD